MNDLNLFFSVLIGTVTLNHLYSQEKPDWLKSNKLHVVQTETLLCLERQTAINTWRHQSLGYCLGWNGVLLVSARVGGLWSVPASGSYGGTRRPEWLAAASDGETRETGGCQGSVWGQVDRFSYTLLCKYFTYKDELKYITYGIFTALSDPVTVRLITCQC